MLLLLVYVLFFGDVRGGARRWIDLGAFNLQPSEFAKATLALVLAKFFAEARRGGLTRTDFVVAAALTAVPALVIARLWFSSAPSASSWAGDCIATGR